MASELVGKYRRRYAKLLRLYPKAYRERFSESMEQTFNDLCRERVQANKGLFNSALWMFVETLASILRENVTSIMKQDSITFLKIVKYGALTVSALMVAGIAALMLLARGKGEDIAGIVAMALLITFTSLIVATVAAVLQKRARRGGGAA
jgi:hypothetical protein